MYSSRLGSFVWPQWERIHLAPQRLDVPGWEDTLGTHTNKGEGERVGGRTVEKGDQERDSEQKIK